jgi:hypothetical protein
LSSLISNGASRGDRVLFLTIPDVAFLGALSKQLQQGIVVCLGEREAVYEHRRAGAHLDNVMFVAATPDEIPWQDGFFNWVSDEGAPAELGVYREVLRVLAPGGALVARSLDNSRLEQAGLRRDGELLRKPEA